MKRAGMLTEKIKIWSSCNFEEVRGRPIISYKTKQNIYDMWLQYSITSVDCRNGSESVKIKKSIYIQRFGSDTRNEIALVEKKKSGKTYYTATRRIATCTIRKLKMKLADTGVVASEGTIQNLKPFYVVYATEREKVLCMCKLCFNTRSLFDALMVHHKENKAVVYTSISKFLMNSCDCYKVENGYWTINCCTGKCSSCKIKAMPIEVSITDPGHPPVHISHISPISHILSHIFLKMSHISHILDNS